MLKTYVGIDNGVSGAIVALDPDDKFLIREPVKTLSIGKRLLLDICGNLEILNGIANRIGGFENMVVVYEKHPINPLWHPNANFANGQNGEFWRVLLTMSKIKFTWVHARTWQAGLLKAFRRNLKGEADTKRAAELFLAQRYPRLEFERKFNVDQQEGIRDAMCIALWSRMSNF